MAPKANKKMTREEVLQRKREAERRRYQRNKSDPQKLIEMKEKEKQKYQKKKDKGLRKLVQDMNPREHRTIKKKWKMYSAKSRTKKTAMKEITNTFIRENTPTDSASDVEVTVIIHENRRSIKGQRSARKGKKMRNKLLKEKDEHIAALKKKIDKYRKRCQRLKKPKESQHKITEVVIDARIENRTREKRIIW